MYLLVRKCLSTACHFAKPLVLSRSCSSALKEAFVASRVGFPGFPRRPRPCHEGLHVASMLQESRDDFRPRHLELCFEVAGT